MARGGGGPLCPLPLSPPRALAACVCLTAFGLQATTKEVKDSLGKQWSQLSDKKRLKWIHKALEQQKEYEVRLPLRSAPAGWLFTSLCPRTLRPPRSAGGSRSPTYLHEGGAF